MRRQELEMRQRRDVSLTRTMRTPHPFPNLSTSGESGIVAASTRNRSGVDARVERHRRFEFAKPKARSRLPSDCRPATYGMIHHAPASSVISHSGESPNTAAGLQPEPSLWPFGFLAIDDKCGAYDEADRHDPSHREGPRHRSSLAEVAP
ncbi:hypothetical protein Plhal710r2_c038g0134251 [Plasmopara halstedii]